MKITLFWDITSYDFVDRCHGFRRKVVHTNKTARRHIPENCKILERSSSDLIYSDKNLLY
jgi:hypothetical protein